MLNSRPQQRFAVAVAVAIALVISPTVIASPAAATTCNTNGCWDAKVTFIRPNSDGSIWFVVEGADALNTLTPADGCQLQSIWAGGANEPALFVRNDDPRAERKYALLLTAFTTGAPIAFAPRIHGPSGLCSVQRIEIHR